MSQLLQAGELHSDGFHAEALAADVQEGNFSIHEILRSPVIPCQQRWTNLATNLSQLYTSSLQDCSTKKLPPETDLTPGIISAFLELSTAQTSALSTS